MRQKDTRTRTFTSLRLHTCFLKKQSTMKELIKIKGFNKMET